MNGQDPVSCSTCSTSLFDSAIFLFESTCLPEVLPILQLSATSVSFRPTVADGRRRTDIENDTSNTSSSSDIIRHHRTSSESSSDVVIGNLDLPSCVSNSFPSAASQRSPEATYGKDIARCTPCPSPWHFGSRGDLGHWVAQATWAL